MSEHNRELPTVARLYYTGVGARRYKRASVHTGPGEALVFKSVAEMAIRQAVALAITRERERAQAAAPAQPAAQPVAQAPTLSDEQKLLQEVAAYEAAGANWHDPLRDWKPRALAILSASQGAAPQVAATPEPDMAKIESDCISYALMSCLGQIKVAHQWMSDRPDDFAKEAFEAMKKAVRHAVKLTAREVRDPVWPYAAVPPQPAQTIAAHEQPSTNRFFAANSPQPAQAEPSAPAARMLTQLELLQAKDNHGIHETADESIQRLFARVNDIKLKGEDHA